MITALTGRLATRGVLSIAALSLLCNLCGLAVPLYNMEVFNLVLPTRDTGTLYRLVAGMILGLLIFGVLDTLRTLAMEALAGQLVRRLSPPLVRAVASAGRGSAAIQEALSDLETVRSFIASADSVAPFDAMWAPVLLLVLLAAHWGFAALAAGCCVILILLNVATDAMTRGQMLAANQASATGLRHVADAVGAAEAVLGLGMLPAMTRRWETESRRAALLVHQATMRSRAVSAIASALRMGMTGAMVALGLVLAVGGFVSGGSMVAGNMILARLLMPFQQAAVTRRRWVDALAAWKRIRILLQDPVTARYSERMPAPCPRLVVENLVHMPPDAGRPLLRGVSFVAEPGDSIGIIGPSSAGKSTLLRMILGMTRPSSGGVFLDGTSTHFWEREDFARHCGYVPQSLMLLEESVAANIAGLRAPNMAAVIAAAKRAGLHRVIAGLPQGYATRVSSGVLSSGQRQRLALARALYHRPRMLVLDEPTAFLDADGEAAVVKVLDQLRAEGTTVLIVTHRPALLANIDKLLVLENGAVTHFGPRPEVLRTVTTPRVAVQRSGEAPLTQKEAVS
jgi:ATP-binding cassette subfamily C protein